jgi:citrate synthase
MKIGLDEVVVAETILSHPDAQTSRLWIRGMPPENAVHDLGYEGIVGLLDQRLSRGERLPGFGNRAFPNGDPRAALLAEALRKVGGSVRLQFATEFERLALAALARHRPDKTLRPNLEIYAALLLDACGIPPNAFTPTFATARGVGWLAHAMEQKATGRMLRPTSRYVGSALRD